MASQILADDADSALIADYTDCADYADCADDVIALQTDAVIAFADREFSIESAVFKGFRK